MSNIILMIIGAILIVFGIVVGIFEIIYGKNKTQKIEQELKADYFN